VVDANATSDAIEVPSAPATSSTGALTDAWMMRTLARPSDARLRSSVKTSRPSWANLPTPATVYAPLGCTVTCVVSTGGVLDGSPCLRMATR